MKTLTCNPNRIGRYCEVSKWSCAHDITSFPDTWLSLTTPVVLNLFGGAEPRGRIPVARETPIHLSA